MTVEVRMVMIMQSVLTQDDGYRNGCMRTQSQPTKRDTPHHHDVMIRHKKMYHVGRAEGARRPAETGPWGLSEGFVYRPRGCASGMGMWACSEGVGLDRRWVFLNYFLFF